MNDPHDRLDALLEEARVSDPLRGHRHGDPQRFLSKLQSRTEISRRSTTTWGSLAAAIALAGALIFVLSETQSPSGSDDTGNRTVASADPETEFEVVAWTDDLETRVELGDLDALVVLSELDALKSEHVDEFLDALFDGA